MIPQIPKAVTAPITFALCCSVVPGFDRATTTAGGPPMPADPCITPAPSPIPNRNVIFECPDIFISLYRT